MSKIILLVAALFILSEYMSSAVQFNMNIQAKLNSSSSSICGDSVNYVTIIESLQNSIGDKLPATTVINGLKIGLCRQLYEDVPLNYQDNVNSETIFSLFGVASVIIAMAFVNYKNGILKAIKDQRERAARQSKK